MYRHILYIDKCTHCAAQVQIHGHIYRYMHTLIRTCTHRYMDTYIHAHTVLLKYNSLVHSALFDDNCTSTL